MRCSFRSLFCLAALALIGFASAYAQEASPPAPAAPPPAPAPGTPPPPPSGPVAAAHGQQFSSDGTIRTWNYGPNGDINGFFMARDTLVILPPGSGPAIARAGRLGSRVHVTGLSHNGLEVPTVVNAQAVSVNGKMLKLGSAVGVPGAEDSGGTAAAGSEAGTPPNAPKPPAAPASPDQG